MRTSPSSSDYSSMEIRIVSTFIKSRYPCQSCKVYFYLHQRWHSDASNEIKIAQNRTTATSDTEKASSFEDLGKDKAWYIFERELDNGLQYGVSLNYLE